MKKYFALLLAGVMALSLAACGGSSSAPATPAETQKEETAAEAPAEEKAEAEAPAAEAPAAEEAAAEIKTVEAGKLHMATNAAFPPYEMISDNGGFEGIDVEIATLIAQKLGLELVVDDMEFGSVITSVQGGKSDIAMAGLTVTEERKQNVDFTESYATGVQVIIVPEGSDIQTVDDLANGKMIGVQDGTTGYIYCSSPVEDGGYGEDHVTSYPALKGGKVDAVVIDNEPAKAFVQANAGLKILDTEYIVENYAIGISKDNNGLRDAVNNALKELIADGSVQLIVDKYINAEK